MNIDNFVKITRPRTKDCPSGYRVTDLYHGSVRSKCTTSLENAKKQRGLLWGNIKKKLGMVSSAKKNKSSKKSKRPIKKSKRLRTNNVRIPSCPQNKKLVCFCD